MLKYLVTSKTRANLLRLLWAENVSGNVSELARLSAGSYSTVHRELRRMESFGLAVSRGETKDVVYAANHKNPHAALLRKLIDSATDAESPNEDDEQMVLANLASHGAPLSGVTEPTESLDVNETLARALGVARRHAAVARVLPLVLEKNKNKLNFDTLKTRATELRQEKALGFFLDVTSLLSHDSHFSKQAKPLRDKRNKHRENFFLTSHGKFAEELARKNTPAVAKHWHFTMNMPLSSFEDIYRKFV